MSLRTDSKSFVPGPTQDKNVKKLNSIRNDFIHYVPAGSALNMMTWTNVVLDVVPIIEFLAFESNNVSFYKEERREKVACLCVMAKNEASMLLKHYSTQPLSPSGPPPPPACDRSTLPELRDSEGVPPFLPLPPIR